MELTIKLTSRDLEEILDPLSTLSYKQKVAVKNLESWGPELAAVLLIARRQLYAEGHDVTYYDRILAGAGVEVE